MRSVLIGLAAVSFVACSSSGMGHHGDSSNAPLAQEVRRATERYHGIRFRPSMLCTCGRGGANPHGVFVDWNPRVSCAEHSAGR
jgi:hypothetical protein